MEERSVQGKAGQGRAGQVSFFGKASRSHKARSHFLPPPLLSSLSLPLPLPLSRSLSPFLSDTIASLPPAVLPRAPQHALRFGRCRLCRFALVGWRWILVNGRSVPAARRFSLCHSPLQHALSLSLSLPTPLPPSLFLFSFYFPTLLMYVAAGLLLSITHTTHPHQTTPITTCNHTATTPRCHSAIPSDPPLPRCRCLASRECCRRCGVCVKTRRSSGRRFSLVHSTGN